VAKLIKKHDYPMVLNCVLTGTNSTMCSRSWRWPKRVEAEYVELANTQYYGWAYVNRDQLLPTREQLRRAEEVTNKFRERIGNKMRIFFVVPDYYEKTARKRA